ncbi:MAG: 2-phospho-L-lactate transferase CofD family protein, partial [Candidatus Margulisiibacteriota bacterium]
MFAEGEKGLLAKQALKGDPLFTQKLPKDKKTKKKIKSQRNKALSAWKDAQAKAKGGKDAWNREFEPAFLDLVWKEATKTDRTLAQVIFGRFVDTIPQPQDLGLKSRLPRSLKSGARPEEFSTEYVYLGGGGYNGGRMGAAFTWIHRTDTPEERARLAPRIAGLAAMTFDDGGHSAAITRLIRHGYQVYFPAPGDMGSGIVISGTPARKDPPLQAKSALLNVKNKRFDLKGAATWRELLDQRLISLQKQSRLPGKLQKELPEDWFFFCANMLDTAEYFDRHLMPIVKGYAPKDHQKASGQNLYITTVALRDGIIQEGRIDTAQGLVRMSEMLGVEDVLIWPATFDDARLAAQPREEGLPVIYGQSAITDAEHQGHFGSVFFTHPAEADVQGNPRRLAPNETPQAEPEVVAMLDQVRSAILVGAGSPFTSAAPQLLPRGVAQALIRAKQRGVAVIYAPKVAWDLETDEIYLREQLQAIERSVQASNGDGSITFERMFSHVILPHVPQSKIKACYHLDATLAKYAKLLTPAGQEQLSSIQSRGDLTTTDKFVAANTVMKDQAYWTDATRQRFLIDRADKLSKTLKYPLMPITDADREYLTSRGIHIYEEMSGKGDFVIADKKIYYSTKTLARHTKAIADAYKAQGTAQPAAAKRDASGASQTQTSGIKRNASRASRTQTSGIKRNDALIGLWREKARLAKEYYHRNEGAQAQQINSAEMFKAAEDVKTAFFYNPFDAGLRQALEEAVTAEGTALQIISALVLVEIGDARIVNMEQRLQLLRILVKAVKNKVLVPDGALEGRIDLHTHTYHSDGILSTAGLVARAWFGGMRTLAVTNHNTFEHMEEAVLAAKVIRDEGFVDFEVIPGIEIDACFTKLPSHILAYFPIGRGIKGRETMDEFLGWLRKTRTSAEARTLARTHNYISNVTNDLLNTLRGLSERKESLSGISFECLELEEKDFMNLQPGYWTSSYVVYALYRKYGVDLSMLEKAVNKIKRGKGVVAGNEDLRASGVFGMKIGDALRFLRSHAAVVFFAHPRYVTVNKHDVQRRVAAGEQRPAARRNLKIARIEATFAKYPGFVDGIEVYHPDQNAQWISALTAFIQGKNAARTADDNILSSCSSDFHGGPYGMTHISLGRRTQLGIGRATGMGYIPQIVGTNYSMVEAIKQRALNKSRQRKIDADEGLVRRFREQLDLANADCQAGIPEEIVLASPWDAGQQRWKPKHGISSVFWFGRVAVERAREELDRRLRQKLGEESDNLPLEFVEPASSHLTLIGFKTQETPLDDDTIRRQQEGSVRILSERLNNSFEFEARGINIFVSKSKVVIIIPILANSKDLALLNDIFRQHLEEMAQDTTIYPEITPHITLAYAYGAMDIKITRALFEVMEELQDESWGVFSADEITLYHFSDISFTQGKVLWKKELVSYSGNNYFAILSLLLTDAEFFVATVIILLIAAYAITRQPKSKRSASEAMLTQTSGIKHDHQEPVRRVLFEGPIREVHDYIKDHISVPESINLGTAYAQALRNASARFPNLLGNRPNISLVEGSPRLVFSDSCSIIVIDRRALRSISFLEIEIEEELVNIGAFPYINLLPGEDAVLGLGLVEIITDIQKAKRFHAMSPSEQAGIFKILLGEGVDPRGLHEVFIRSYTDNAKFSQFLAELRPSVGFLTTMRLQQLQERQSPLASLV